MKEDDSYEGFKSYFLFKIYSKNYESNFAIRNLLASFKLDLFTNLNDLKILISPLKKNGPFYIESSSKNIEKNLSKLCNTDKFSKEMISFKSKLLRIFHLGLNIPSYVGIERGFFETKTVPRVIWKLNKIYLDYIFISKIYGNHGLKYTNNDKSLMNNNKRKTYSNDRERKKIRIDLINIKYNIIGSGQNMPNLDKKKAFKELITRRYPTSWPKKLNSTDIGDILMEKNTKQKLIIVSVDERNLHLLSFNNEKASFSFNEINKRFVRLSSSEVKLSKGHDKNGRSLMPGNYCQIVKGHLKNAEGVVLFCANESFFIKTRILQKGINIYGINACDLERTSQSVYYEKHSYNNEPLVVTITHGHYKGYNCRVLKKSDNFLEVLILSTSKLIKISEKNVQYR